MLKPFVVIKYLLAVGLVVLLTQSAAADEQPHYDRINLTVDVVDEVESDTLVAVLYAQREGSDLTPLSDEVNKIIGQAVARSKKVSEVGVQTLSYQTHPNYQKQRLVGWRVRQSIQLKSRNIDALSKLLGELQDSLAVESIGYQVSPVLRSKVEEKLIAEAIAAFQQRAQNITQHLGRKRYRLVTMNVNTGGAPIRPMRYRTEQAMLESKIAQPTIEPGTQSITVVINGVIELEVN